MPIGRGIVRAKKVRQAMIIDLIKMAVVGFFGLGLLSMVAVGRGRYKLGALFCVLALVCFFYINSFPREVLSICLGKFPT